MRNIPDLEQEALRTYRRLVPRLEQAFGESVRADEQGWLQFSTRLRNHFPALFKLYFRIYGQRYDFIFHLEDLLAGMAQAWLRRPADLRGLDQAREKNPLWFQSHQMLGGVCYVDLYGENFEGMKSKIPYFKELGLTYLHLMPLFKVPEGENDGGYAVSSYRDTNPSLGTMEELASLARDLRTAGISLVLDLVFNHTSDEHLWAERAKAGDGPCQEFYHIYADRTMPDAYERNLREIFPEEHPGAFTYRADVDGWVWTTFHSYQWDLNYSNPAVFNHMAEEMLYLANQGVEVLRLDAVAFIWKQLGTNCENLPQAHVLIQAFNTVARIASPSLLFKSEAIVHPDEVVKYLGPHECQLSYNPLLMALLWNSLATRKVRLLSQALSARFRIDPACAWVNYVRVHDDIGWTFSDEDAALLGINGGNHRRFLNEFYRGRFPGSFARGLPFQENPLTGDCRISGTCASLAGLEKAIEEEGNDEIGLAVRRILLIHGIILTIGGIPLLYLGDEIGTLNDYSYRNDPAHERDSRWVHRPRADWKKYASRGDAATLEGRVYRGLKNLIALRKHHEVFSGGEVDVIQTGNEHVLGFARYHAGKHAVLLANFSEGPQVIAARIVDQHALYTKHRLHGLGKICPHEDFIIQPLDFVILVQ